MRILIAFFLFVWTTGGIAGGNEVGNGGDVIVCGEKVELFDFYESSMLKREKIPPAKGKDPFLLAREKIGHLKKLNSQLERQYLHVLSKIKARLKFIEDARFRDIKDSFEVAIPKGCQIEQLAIQQDELNQRVIHISKKLWEKLSIRDRAGLILHEIIYEHFIFLGEKNSVKVRRFNSFLFSARVVDFAKADYLKFVRKLKIPLY